ncbi:MAG: hypothetical protein ACXVRK_14225 [Gaiellaceae bacterium]
MTAAEARRTSEQDGLLRRRSAIDVRTDAIVESLTAEGTDETLAQRVALCVIGRCERSGDLNAAPAKPARSA